MDSYEKSEVIQEALSHLLMVSALNKGRYLSYETLTITFMRLGLQNEEQDIVYKLLKDKNIHVRSEEEINRLFTHEIPENVIRKTVDLDLEEKKNRRLRNEWTKCKEKLNENSELNRLTAQYLREISFFKEHYREYCEQQARQDDVLSQLTFALISIGEERRRMGWSQDTYAGCKRGGLRKYLSLFFSKAALDFVVKAVQKEDIESIDEMSLFILLLDQFVPSIPSSVQNRYLHLLSD